MARSLQRSATNSAERSACAESPRHGCGTFRDIRRTGAARRVDLREAQRTSAAQRQRFSPERAGVRNGTVDRRVRDGVRRPVRNRGRQTNAVTDASVEILRVRSVGAVGAMARRS